MRRLALSFVLVVVSSELGSVLADPGDLLQVYEPGLAGPVATLGENVLMGAFNVDVGGVDDAGAVYMFEGYTGDLIRVLQNPDPDEQDNFGVAVAAVGDDVLVGAHLDDAGAENAGAVFVGGFCK